MVESEFIDDAVEGLQAFSSESKLEHFVDEINKNLGIQLQERKQKKEKRKIKTFCGYYCCDRNTVDCYYMFYGY